MPEVKARYRTTDESAVVGESLAGLWVTETFLLAPDLFDTYIAFDPSLWWNNQHLVKVAGETLPKHGKLDKKLYVATSGEGTPELAQRLVDSLQKSVPVGIRVTYDKMPEERHATIYHPAALKAFRALFKPAER
jgi:predicted alpha/beta superfamily hydrolase